MNAFGDIVVARDKFGFRPLVIGENEDMICVACLNGKYPTVAGCEFLRKKLVGM